VAVNKLDLVPDGERDALLAGIARRLRPSVKQVGTSDGRLPIAVALGLGAAAEDDLAARPSLHELDGEHDHDDFDSFVLQLGAIADPAALAQRLEAVIARHDILRVKGFLAVAGA